MASKKAKRKKVVKKARSIGTDQNSFLLILGGGFVIIVLIMIFWGAFSASRSHREDAVNKESAYEMSKDTVITIQNNTFSSPVIVKKGAKVTFMNNDTEDHTVVSDDGSFNLGVVTANGPKSYTFAEEGTYSYHCTMHPGMEGTVIVE